MPAFYEAKLKQEYGAHSDIPYKVMNKQGYMHGNQETAKGRALDATYQSDAVKGLHAAASARRS